MDDCLKVLEIICHFYHHGNILAMKRTLRAKKINIYHYETQAVQFKKQTNKKPSTFLGGQGMTQHMTQKKTQSFKAKEILIFHNL